MLIIGETGATFFCAGQAKVVSDTHPKYESIVDAARRGDFQTASELMDMEASVRKVIPDGARVEIVDGEVLFSGRPVHGHVVDRILSFADHDIDVQPLVLFLERLLRNPSSRSIDELFGFLEASGLPITSDGHFLAYKRIRENWTDIHSGRFDNSVGTVVEMERQDVNPDKDQTCSAGLHFCSYRYLPHFGSNHGNRVVIVKIDPADVVSIPSDYDNAKGRCCRYLVLEEIDQETASNGFKSPVHDTAYETFEYRWRFDNDDPDWTEWESVSATSEGQANYKAVEDLADDFDDMALDYGYEERYNFTSEDDWLDYVMDSIELEVREYDEEPEDDDDGWDDWDDEDDATETSIEPKRDLPPRDPLSPVGF